MMQMMRQRQQHGIHVAQNFAIIGGDARRPDVRGSLARAIFVDVDRRHDFQAIT